MATREEMATFRTMWKIGANNDAMEFERVKTRLITAIEHSVGEWLALNDRRVGTRFAFYLGVAYRPYNQNYLWKFAFTALSKNL